MKLILRLFHSPCVGIRTCSDYSPFGVELDGRTVSAGYRYGFQNQEKDDEIKGEGNSVNYTFRMHDSRLGRFFTIDPLFMKYPSNSSFSFSENNVIACVELEGAEKYWSADGKRYLGQIGTDESIRIINSKENEKHVLYAIYKQQNCHMAKFDKLSQQYEYDVMMAYRNSYSAKLLTDPFTRNINAVIDRSIMDLTPFVKWKSQFSAEFGNLEAQQTACLRACVAICKNAGVKRPGQNSTNVIQTAKEVGNDLVIDEENSKKGVDYINTELERGFPMVVGVNHTIGNNYNEKTTDHFIVIVGKGFDNNRKQVFYTYYEVGKRLKQDGMNVDNKLYLQDNGALSQDTKNNLGHKYTVTQVRKNE